MATTPFFRANGPAATATNPPFIIQELKRAANEAAVLFQKGDFRPQVAHYMEIVYVAPKRCRTKGDATQRAHQGLPTPGINFNLNFGFVIKFCFTLGDAFNSLLLLMIQEYRVFINFSHASNHGEAILALKFVPLCRCMLK